MIYGYARISTTKQSIERQIRNIKKAYPDALIVQEVWTGTTSDRKEWVKLKAHAIAGDTIIFDSVSRMSRNASEGFEEYQKLFARDVNLIFLKEPHINSSTYKAALNSCKLPSTGTAVDHILNGITEYLMELAKEQIRLAFEQSEKEISDLHQRTAEGIETARLHGKQIGQRPGNKLITKKSIEAKKIIQRHSKVFGGSLSDVEVMKLAGISRNTYYKYKRELKGINF